MEQQLDIPVVSSVISKDQIVEEKEKEEEENDNKCSGIYQPRTFRAHNINSERRWKVLPAYPQAKNHPIDQTLLLLCNVPHINRDQLEEKSFCGGHGISPFNFVQHRYMQTIDSFMIDFYRDLFEEPSQRWKIPYSLIDYNLSRLRTCMHLYTQQTNQPAILSLNEWSLALEFFLQIDVDVFFMKTCNFRGAHPRLFSKEKIQEPEGLICQAKPQARYGMMPCYDRNCSLCLPQSITNAKSRKPIVAFATKQSHRFINKYETFLNCDANCNSLNVIYVLTCHCEQCDFIGSTSISFHDCILKHRDENNRIVREFLIGSNNIKQILQYKARSPEIVANNEMFLYQHSPRCSLCLQLFLDKNPDYWCLVPMSLDEARESDRTTMISTDASYIYTTVQPPQSPTFAKKPRLFDEVLRNNTRSEEESTWLSKCVPKPPSGYRFSRQQIIEQINFFKFRKDFHILSSNLVDFYTYTIVAVLPDDCSNELRRFIEALFITHTETRLNTLGRLTHRGPWSSPLDDSDRGRWCDKLVRPSPPPHH
ncbi:unnamed protein product [Adineta steineri]|uniref:Uncharacterized protein n=1 Tax=Adineta steineri TaxID=433720 RepID=A0A819RP45_9BILA|nr:unnamed protein product [Adineta steineri]CAF4043953.1 unnamed protein product [Adineta steineri]